MKGEQYSVNIGLIKTNIRQLFMSRNLYICIFLNLFIMMLTFFSNYNQGISDAYFLGVCHEFFYFMYFGMLPKLIVLVSALPVVNGFCTDWNTGYIRLEAGRAGTSRYLCHKICVCMVGTFITAFVSLLIFTLILRGIMPMTTELGSENLEIIYPFGGIVRQHPYIYQLIRIICFSNFCSIWATLGLAFSAYIPNRYVVYSVAFVSYYVIEQIVNNKIADHVPTFLMLPYLGNTSLTTPLFGNEIIDFLYINILFIILALIFGMIFVHGAKRRLRNEFI